MEMKNTVFSNADMKAFEPTMKIGLLATVSDEGLPHLTLISSLQASSPTQMMWGQFTEGLSKRFIRSNPKTGFMVMTMDKEIWRGKTTFTHTQQQGAGFEMYNNTPMFRYNAYFGIHTVYYMDLVANSGRHVLPMGKVVRGAIQTMIAKTFSARSKSAPVLNLWTRKLLNQFDALKFLAYVDADGYPVIIPVIQAQSKGSDTLIFSAALYHDDLAAIPQAAPVAMLGMTLDMEDVLLRGTFMGLRRVGGVRCGTIKVDWVYNSMPPVPQQIYPAVAMEPVRRF